MNELLLTYYTHCFIIFFNPASNLYKLGTYSFKVFRDNILDKHITGCSRCNHKGSCFYLIRNNRICGSMQFLNALNSDNICTGALDIGTHTVKEIGNVNYMRLLSCILNSRSSLCQACCKHNVNSGSNRYNIHIYVPADKLLCLCTYHAMLYFNRSTHYS